MIELVREMHSYQDKIKNFSPKEKRLYQQRRRYWIEKGINPNTAAIKALGSSSNKSSIAGLDRPDFKKLDSKRLDSKKPDSDINLDSKKLDFEKPDFDIKLEKLNVNLGRYHSGRSDPSRNAPSK